MILFYYGIILFYYVIILLYYVIILLYYYLVYIHFFADVDWILSFNFREFGIISVNYKKWILSCSRY